MPPRLHDRLLPAIPAELRPRDIHVDLIDLPVTVQVEAVLVVWPPRERSDFVLYPLYVQCCHTAVGRDVRA